MKLLFLLSLLAYCTVCKSRKPTEKSEYKFLPSGKDPLEIIRGYGYPAESYQVVTTDGYILLTHRIPHGKRSKSAKLGITNFPVFIHHGFLGSSVDFIITGPENGLAFILADLGFDVWLGNARGNAYSRAHTNLSPDDLQFWNFTWHESAIYDLPAQIDFIRDFTNKEKVIYMGYSMGTSMFLVLTSTLLEYNERIEASFLMAPAAFFKNVKSPVLWTLSHFLHMIKLIHPNLEFTDFLPESPLFKLAEKLFCTRLIILPEVCKNIIFLIVGDDTEQYNKELIDKYLDYFPSGYSTKAAFHYSQLTISGKFRQYDYGTSGNILMYGQRTPPDYKLKNIKVPVFLYYGNNDYLTTPPNVEILAGHLGSLKSMYLVKYKKFSHLDFFLGDQVRFLLYNKIIKDLNNFLLK